MLGCFIAKIMLDIESDALDKDQPGIRYSLALLLFVRANIDAKPTDPETVLTLKKKSR